MSSSVDAGDTAWMLMSSALVLFMTPGLAFFYGGLVNQKSVLNTMAMSFIAMAVISIQWFLVGYTFAFGRGNPGWGNFDFGGMNGVGQDPNADYAPTIPHQVFMVYQMMFAIITPPLMSGAIVDRMRFVPYTVFIVLWATLVYDPIVHWIWSGYTDTDGVMRLGWLRNLGIMDYAGGLVVHTSAGTGALVAAWFLGPRPQNRDAQPHNIPFVLLGAGMLWFGWFGFNAGSALSASGPAGVAFVNSQLAAAMAMLTWMILDYYYISKGKWSAMKMAEGCVIGLATVTPAAGFIHLYSALAFGFGGAVVIFLVAQFKHKKFPNNDDSLDVFCCHGVGGALGIFMLGFFASHAVNPSGNDGAFFGNARQLGVQILGIVVVTVHSMVLTFVILFCLKKTIGLTAEIPTASDSIDQIEHGQPGYVYDLVPIVKEETASPKKSRKEQKKEVNLAKTEVEMKDIKEIDDI